MFVDIVEVFDVGIVFGFECWLVERGCFLNVEVVGFGLVDGFGDKGGVESYFFWYIIEMWWLVLVWYVWLYGMVGERYVFYVDICVFEFFFFNYYGFCVVFWGGGFGGIEVVVVVFDYEEVGFFGDGCYVDYCGWKVFGDGVDVVWCNSFGW